MAPQLLTAPIGPQIVEANRVDRILEIIERSGGDFNAVNISTAFHRLAKMWHDPQARAV